MSREAHVRVLFCAIANVAAAVPIFVIGGSFIWGSGLLPCFGLAAVAYSLVSFVTLYWAWSTPNKIALRVEGIAVASLLAVALWLFLVKGVFEYRWAFALGAALVLSAKWGSLAYIARWRAAL